MKNLHTRLGEITMKERMKCKRENELTQKNCILNHFNCGSFETFRTFVLIMLDTNT